jgi:hypothetical protein
MPDSSHESNQRMIQVLRQLSSLADEAWMRDWDLLISALIRQLKSRAKLYRLVMSIDPNRDQLSDLQSDFLLDFESSITGHCDYSCILKFPNEPTEQSALLDYLHSNKWKESGEHER